MEISNKKVLITGGMGFIGSNLAARLVHAGNFVTLVDSLIPEYGGNARNLHGIEDRVNVNVSDVRDTYAINQLVKDQDYLFNLAGQTSHLDSMNDPFTVPDIFLYWTNNRIRDFYFCDIIIDYLPLASCCNNRH